MDYATSLFEETESETSAYMQFVTGKGREGFAAYAFVEDNDDIVFYQHALTDLENVSFIGCGGKNGVLSVYRKTSSEGLADGQLFFVDRDTEDDPFEAEQEVLRTAQYSWENQLCQSHVVKRFLQRKVSPSLTRSECNEVEQAWSKTIANFKHSLALHTALVKVSSELKPTLEMRKVGVVKDAFTQDLEVLPAEQKVLETLSEKKDAAISRGVNPKRITEIFETYFQSDLLKTAKGKTVYSVFKLFSKNVSAYYNRGMIADVNNTISVLSAMPANSPDLQYIRDYAQRRIGQLAV